MENNLIILWGENVSLKNVSCFDRSSRETRRVSFSCLMLKHRKPLALYTQTSSCFKMIRRASNRKLEDLKWIFALWETRVYAEFCPVEEFVPRCTSFGHWLLWHYSCLWKTYMLESALFEAPALFITFWGPKFVSLDNFESKGSLIWLSDTK